MCSISGYMTLGGKLPSKDTLEQLFIAGENRGTDASGIAFLDENNKIQVFKDQIKSSEFIASETWRNLEIPTKMIMHTRAATQGSKTINDNNHPIVNEAQTKALIHNGVIANEDDFGIPLTEVDSKAVMVAYEKYANKQDLFTNLKGGYAIALLDEENPKELVLFRHTNPMKFLFDIENDILYFASTTEMLDKIPRTKTDFHGFEIQNKFVETELGNNNWAILNEEEGLTFLEEFTPPTYYTKPYNYSRDYRGNYGSGYGYGYNEDEFDYEKNWNPKVLIATDTEEMIKDINESLENENFKMIKCEKCGNPVILDLKQQIQSCDWCNTKINLEEEKKWIII